MRLIFEETLEERILDRTQTGKKLQGTGSKPIEILLGTGFSQS